MERKPHSVLKQIDVSCSEFRKLRDQRNTCDVHLVCSDGVKLPAHRLILHAGSKYFEAMFTSNMKEASSNEIEFPTIRKETMQLVLDFLYFQDVRVKALSDEQTCDLLSATHLIEVHALLEECVTELLTKITLGNWTKILRVAHKYSIEILSSFVVQYLARENLSEDVEMLKLEFDYFKTFIINSTIHKCHSADTLVRLILIWVADDKINRRIHVQDLFSPIDFSSVSKTVVTAIMDDNDLFINNSALSHFVLKKISLTYAPNALLSATNPKILIFKSKNAVHSFDLTRKIWSVENLLETLMPEPNSAIAVSDQAIYYKAKATSHQGCGYLRDSETHFIMYYPSLNCANEIATHSKLIKFGLLFLNDALYLLEGAHELHNVNYTFESFDLNSKKWQRLASPKLIFEDPVIVTSNGSVFAVDGRNELSSLEKFCPNTKQWTIVNTNNTRGMLITDRNVIVAPCLSKIYFTSEYTLFDFDKVLVEFDPEVNLWKSVMGLKCGTLCGSSKPLEFLIFLQNGKCYLLDPRTKKTVLVAENLSTAAGENNEGMEPVTTVVFG